VSCVDQLRDQPASDRATGACDEHSHLDSPCHISSFTGVLVV
jgi:hypothetical protein